MAAAERSGDDAAIAAAYVAQALVWAAEGDRERNRRCYEMAMERATEASDLVTQVRVLNNLASSEIEQGHYSDALELLEDSLSRCEDHGPVPLGAALARLNRGEALLGLGRVDEALPSSTWRGRRTARWTRHS